MIQRGNPLTMSSIDNNTWIDIFPALYPSFPNINLTQSKIWEWSLVLASKQIEHIINKRRGTWQILVYYYEQNMAIEEIYLYEEENKLVSVEKERKGVKGGIEPSIWSLSLLVIFYKVTQMPISIWRHTPVPWYNLGSVNAHFIFQGEWWRLITGLTLHANLTHLMGNIFIGGVFIILLCRELGSGLGWFLSFFSGVLGNMINTIVRGYPHDSIGASTAVFGAVGILGGIRSIDKKNGALIQKMFPFAAGLGLVALLGTGGEHTDVGAHVFGFLAGFVLGVFIESLQQIRVNISSKKLNICLGITVLGMNIAAWTAALLFGNVSES